MDRINCLQVYGNAALGESWEAVGFRRMGREDDVSLLKAMVESLAHGVYGSAHHAHTLHNQPTEPGGGIHREVLLSMKFLGLWLIHCTYFYNLNLENLLAVDKSIGCCPRGFWFFYS